jgi:hypothetical protein
VDESFADGRKHLTYEAAMVHDFAWAADPKFVESFTDYHGIRIRQLIQPDRAADSRVHLEAQVAALASYEARFGPYPWSTITIVHPPEGAAGAGGMEYPTLYTTSNYEPHRELPGTTLNRFSGLFTTVHEFGHQYFQGLFASNEHAQPWLDEGMNTTSNHLVMLDNFGENAWMVNVFGQKLTVHDELQLAMGIATRLDPIDQTAADFQLYRTYGLMTYAKTAATMLTLRNLVADVEPNPWDEAMRVYAERARFAHPKGGELEDVLVHEIGGELGRFPVAGEGGPGTVWLDVRDFLDQALRGTEEVDFALLVVENHPKLGHGGYHRDEHGVLVETEAEERPEAKRRFTLGSPRSRWASLPDDAMEGVVTIHRKGGFRVPVELLVEFTDGSEKVLAWDGRDRHVTFEFPGQRVRRAVLDPRRRLLLEHHRLDNAVYAYGQGGDDYLSAIVGDMHEGASLALMGGLGP